MLIKHSPEQWAFPLTIDAQLEWYSGHVVGLDNKRSQAILLEVVGDDLITSRSIVLETVSKVRKIRCP
jgi:hypothetical protein